MTDEIVRSIRIATTLNERFGAILREVAQPMEVRDFELRIGEAQQLYPEIWRHFDEARRALAGQGSDVAAYDAIRATEVGHLAVAGIDSASTINPLALAVGQLQVVEAKTATFNHEGHAKATAAGEALMQARPDVDWRALERAEAAEIASFGSLQSGKFKQLAITGAALGGLAVVIYIVAQVL